MGQTDDASPFMECADSHWASLSGWTEDSADLGDDAEFDDGDEAFIMTTKAIDATGSVTRGSGWFLRLRLGRHVLRRRHADDATRDAASRHTTTNYQLASLYYVLN